MSDRELHDLLEDAGSRVIVGPPPVDDLLVEIGRGRRRRGMFAVAAAAAVAGVVTAGVVVVGPGGRLSGAPGPGAAPSPVSEPSGTNVSVPPRPEPFTMDAVQRIALAQRFRDYTGPTPPPFSEADALARSHVQDAYSLGLWDVGIVHHGGAVGWHSVWIIASIQFVPDLNAIMSGPVGTDRPSEPAEPRPGWVRDATMYDGVTGTFVMAYGF
jgi:hypothetical protein